MSELHVKLGKLLRYKRKQKGYSQQELGDRVGYDQRAISSFEKGIRKVDAIALFAMAGELECSVNDLNPLN